MRRPQDTEGRTRGPGAALAGGLCRRVVLLRASHLEKLRAILDDPEATDNDKFVAYTMLLNQVVAADGELPTCQDTGTAICIGHKGEDVWTGADDACHIARGVYETYAGRNLRYSQVVPSR